jgi:hypothetical protein
MKSRRLMPIPQAQKPESFARKRVLIAAETGANSKSVERGDVRFGACVNGALASVV